MERWTKRSADGVLLSEDHEEKYTLIELIDILLERLADYEDTGMDPEIILELLADANAMHDELKRYKEAEKSGRLVVLPTEDFNFTIRGDLALGIILANCRAWEREKDKEYISKDIKTEKYISKDIREDAR